MSLLRIKNADGTWIHIPAINGEPGKDGVIQYVAGEGIKIEDNVISSTIDEEKVKTITGNPENLNTNDKSNLVDAINEINNNVKIFYKFSTIEEWQNIVDALKQGKKAILISKSRAGNTNSGAFDDATYYSPDTSTIDWDNFHGYLNFKSDWWMTSYTDVYKNYEVGLIPKWHVIQVQVTYGGIVTRTQYTISTHNNIANVVSYLPVLGKKNKAEYVPTEDYHPATKKYVDDIVGDINTILETLTTVEEKTE